MNKKEFDKISDKYFGGVFEGYEGGKISSGLRHKLNDSLQLEFAIRMDRDGWNEIFGSSFIYEVRPKYRGEYAYPLVKQLRLLELKEYDPSLLRHAQRILNTFAGKLGTYEGSEGDDYYVWLKSPWSEQKTNDYASSSNWYYFYDAEDILGWHKATDAALRRALADFEDKIAKHNFEEARSKPKMMTMVVDPETGEMKVQN